MALSEDQREAVLRYVVKYFAPWVEQQHDVEKQYDVGGRFGPALVEDSDYGWHVSWPFGPEHWPFYVSANAVPGVLVAPITSKSLVIHDV